MHNSPKWYIITDHRINKDVKDGNCEQVLWFESEHGKP